MHPQHIREGWVRLRSYRADPSKLTGDTVYDNDIIRSVRHPTVFPKDQYDELLAKLSEVGFGLETHDEEDL